MRAKAFGNKGFALVDGGHFANLPSTFKRTRLFARSLFLDRADREVQAAGPWLVSLGQAPDALPRLLDLTEDKPATVFWRCQSGEAILFRHLRKLNMARIPRWAARGDEEPAGTDDHCDELVMFRHWDPRVLAALLPTLDARQFARIIGDADEIAFEAPDYGFRRVLRDEMWPSPVSGPLRIGTLEMLALSQRRMSVSRRRIATYLRTVAPHETASLDDATLERLLATSEGFGKRFGLRSEQEMGRWAYVMAKREWRAADQPDIVDFMRSGPAAPGRKVASLVDRIVEEEAREPSGGALG